MNRPIYDALKRLSNDDIYSFCMPGHKRNVEVLEQLHKFVNLDYTEIEETDNMHSPQGIIKNSMDIIADTFGASRSYFLVNGSSCGVLASIMTLCGTVLVARNSHISVYNALILSGATPVYIYPTIKDNICCSINIKDIQQAINIHTDIKAFIITSPTYEGFTENIQQIADFLHTKGIILIVDEAHGAHFEFCADFPSPSIRCGADIVIQSFHKTLPSLTQCAVLHTSGELIDIDMLEKCLSIVQTTSPSYMFMCSIEYATYFSNINRHLFDEYCRILKKIRRELYQLKNLVLINNELTNHNNMDISRFTFLINSDVNGKYIHDKLRQNRIQIELYSDNYIIAISTICDTKEALNQFKIAVITVDRELEHKKKPHKIINGGNLSTPITQIRTAFYKNKQLVELKDACGHICGRNITPYPPAVPLVAIGEIITQGDIDKIHKCLKNGICVLGIENGVQVVL